MSHHVTMFQLLSGHYSLLYPYTVVCVCGTEWESESMCVAGQNLDPWPDQPLLIISTAG